MLDIKILIIEDDPDQVLGLKLRLEAYGYQVVHASDAVAAIKIARVEMPDLILLDIGLPAGDGFVVMQRLSNLTDVAHIPIIIISARDPEQNASRAFDAGAYDYFQKPVDNHEVLEAIEGALGIGLAV